MTRAPIRARVVASTPYGRPALALKVEGGDLSVQLIAAGFQDGDVVEIVAGETLQPLATEVERLRDLWNDATTVLRLADKESSINNPFPLMDALKDIRELALEVVVRETPGTRELKSDRGTAACYLAAHDDGRPDPHGEADPARAE